MTWVKFCGMKSLDDALLAARLGVDALGFNFYKGSSRYIAPAEAARIIAALPKHIEVIGVFVNELDDRVEAIARECGLQWLQFHGDEPPSYCRRFAGRFLKALRVEKAGDLRLLPAYLEAESKRFFLDSRREGKYGGSGEVFDWDLALAARDRGELVLSGGLCADNLKVALAKVRPFGVDVASGIESDAGRKPGVKDAKKMQDFLERVRRWDRAQSGP